MSEQKQKIKYAIFVVTVTDPNSPEREFVTDFDEEVYDHEVGELIETFGRLGLEYDYAIVEKQYHRIGV